MVNILTADENGKTYLLTKTISQSELSGSLLLESQFLSDPGVPGPIYGSGCL